MPSGGARARSGPAPDPNALRRDRKDDVQGWVTLPAEGRSGPAPAWPLGSQTSREEHLWGVYWAKPQAIIWERDNLVEVVALFVRQFVEAEKPSSSAENRKTVRMMMADLYLNSDSLARARFRIGTPEVAEAAPVKPARASIKSRLTVVSGSGD